jgi:phage/conjugal plasmid C-4 type zinc finger TraR family protein
MADQFDIAQDLDARYLQQALAVQQRNRLRGDSRTHCLECGETIPEARRALVPGCQYCIECAEDIERTERK